MSFYMTSCTNNHITALKFDKDSYNSKTEVVQLFLQMSLVCLMCMPSHLTIGAELQMKYYEHGRQSIQLTVLALGYNLASTAGIYSHRCSQCLTVPTVELHACSISYICNFVNCSIAYVHPKLVLELGFGLGLGCRYF